MLAIEPTSTCWWIWREAVRWRLRREDLHFALPGVCGAERHGAVAVLGKGLPGDDIPEYRIQYLRRKAPSLRDPITST